MGGKSFGGHSLATQEPIQFKLAMSPQEVHVEGREGKCLKGNSLARSSLTEKGTRHPSPASALDAEGISNECERTVIFGEKETLIGEGKKKKKQKLLRGVDTARHGSTRGGKGQK